MLFSIFYLFFLFFPRIFFLAADLGSIFRTGPDVGQLPGYYEGEHYDTGTERVMAAVTGVEMLTGASYADVC